MFFAQPTNNEVLVMSTKQNQPKSCDLVPLNFRKLLSCFYQNVPLACCGVKVVEISNMVFSIIFSVEMVLKLAAYGIVKYVSDGFNVFDGFIVILRCV